MKLDVESFTLSNGLRVVVNEDHRAPLVAVDIAYHVGSKDEVWGKTGFAHLFEHLMFEGSTHAPGKTFDQVLQSIGADNNAYTTEDFTNYYEILPSHQLEIALWLESDRMRFLSVDERSFRNQLDVVIEERRQRVDNQPYGTSQENLAKFAFQHHPYRWPVIGYVEHLEKSTLEDVTNFYQTYYAPNNATLIISGDVQLQQLKDLVDKYFGEFSPSLIKKNDFPMDPLLSSDVKEIYYDQIQLPAFFIGYKTVAETHPDYFPLDFLSDILSGGKSSRLYQELVMKRRLAQGISTWQEASEHPGLWGMAGIAIPSISLETLEHATFDIIAEIAAKGVTEKEVEKVKNSSISTIFSRMQGVGNQADLLAKYSCIYKNDHYMETAVSRLLSVQSDDVQRVANEYLMNRHKVTLHYLPKNSN